MPLFSIKNWISFLSFLVGIELAIGSGRLKVTANMFPAAWLPSIMDWSAALAVIGAAAIGLISRSLPDGDTSSVPSAPKVPAAAMLAILALGAGLMLAVSVGTASAQIKRPQVTGNIIEDIKANNAAGVTPGQGVEASVAKLKDVALVDIVYAKALADAIGTPRSKIRATCYGAWIKVIQQSQGLTAGDGGKPLGAPPDPSLFTHFEQGVEVIDNLQPDSDFMVACQPAANLLKQSIFQFISTAVGGVASAGALGIGIP